MKICINLAIIRLCFSFYIFFIAYWFSIRFPNNTVADYIQDFNAVLKQFFTFTWQRHLLGFIKSFCWSIHHTYWPNYPIIIFVTNKLLIIFFTARNFVFLHYNSFLNILLVFIGLLQPYFHIYFFYIFFFSLFFFWKISVKMSCLFLHPLFVIFFIVFCCFYFVIH